MSNEPRMMKCNMIECGGKLQPHSFDSTVQNGDRRRTGMDCDGPCSQRRVDEWKARMKQPTKKPEPEPEPVPEDTRTDEEVRADMCYWKQ